MEPWLDEYIELMFGNSRSMDTMNRAAEIKYQHMPEKMYKYRYFCKNHLSALQNDCLYSSDSDHLNDIREAPISILTDKLKQRALQKAYDDARENNPWLPVASLRDEYDLSEVFHSLHVKEHKKSSLPYPQPGKDAFIDALVSWVETNFKMILDQHLHAIKNMYNVCCFSSELDEDLMWSHYADSHRGYCIQYDFKSLGLLDDRVQLLFPVIYQDSPSVEIEDLDAVDGSLVMYALTLKNTKWSYEKEWRSFYMHTEKPHSENMPKPKAVYLGAKVKEEDKKIMLGICSEKSIPLYQMTLPNVNASLQPVRLL